MLLVGIVVICCLRTNIEATSKLNGNEQLKKTFFTELTNIRPIYEEAQSTSNAQNSNIADINSRDQSYPKTIEETYLPVLHKVPNVIEVLPEQRVLLSCIVENLGDQTISWIRSKDLQILTSRHTVFTSDSRISLVLSEINNSLSKGIIINWGLSINGVKESDSGQYECQVNTEPKLKLSVALSVKENQQMDIPVSGPIILGLRHHIVKINATVEFKCLCEITNRIEIFPILTDKSQKTSAKLVQWLKNNESLNLQRHGGGVYINTEWTSNNMVESVLIINLASAKDSGFYICDINGVQSEHVELDVVIPSLSHTINNVNIIAPAPFNRLIFLILFCSFIELWLYQLL